MSTGATATQISAGVSIKPGIARVPLLILHGTADTLTSPAGSREFYERAGSSDKTYKTYDGAYHNLFVETNREEVYDEHRRVDQRARLTGLRAARGLYTRPTMTLGPMLSGSEHQTLDAERALLDDIRAALARSGADEASIVELGQSIAQLDELFLLVVVGEFNSGKSAFIIALIGRQLLAEGVTPTTADDRETAIAAQAAVAGPFVNPLALCRAVDDTAGEDAVFVLDGGDFAATASYVLAPRAPLRHLDPGVFGTLGVGGGFALGPAVARAGAEVWILYGDGAAAYSLAEFDTFVRHRIPVVAIVGNDAGWTQIAREQTAVLGDDVGTVLRQTDYHLVAQGYGGEGLLVLPLVDAGEGGDGEDFLQGDRGR